jgi:hypothetical protein
MYRFVDKPKGIFWFSAILNGSVLVAIMAFGAPPVTLFWVGCAGMFFVSHAIQRNRKQRRKQN